MAHTLTDQQTDDPSQVAPLLDQIDGGIARVTADGTYDGAPIYVTIFQYGADSDGVIPPRLTAEFSSDSSRPTRRDHPLQTKATAKKNKAR